MEYCSSLKQSLADLPLPDFDGVGDKMSAADDPESGTIICTSRTSMTNVRPKKKPRGLMRSRPPGPRHVGP